VQRIRVIDTHTGGEPTRVVIAGGPELGSGPMAERLAVFRDRYDTFRSAVINEPRGSDVMVGALVVEPVDPTTAAGVIFFNNVGYLGMCGHGTIGVAVTLAHLGRIGPGTHRLETPVGVVSFDYHGGHRVTVENVPSYRHAKGITVDVAGHGPITGDVAWGGNWFFLASTAPPCELQLANVGRLTEAATAVQAALLTQDVRGKNGARIDHIEFFAPPRSSDAMSRNFVLCPGGAYDRSPCGTGTSAKLACLAADGKLRPGEVWVQESVIGSRFRASFAPGPNGGVLPRISGRAFICAESKLVERPGDPFRYGFGGGPPA
jgi:4-hydroxyproline epimerase